MITLGETKGPLKEKEQACGEGRWSLQSCPQGGREYVYKIKF